jgi:hypothetical protein
MLSTAVKLTCVQWQWKGSTHPDSDLKLSFC